jgi:hypothetical protein
MSSLSKSLKSLDPGAAPPQPRCECCRDVDGVHWLPLVAVERDVKFWRCDRCGYVWGTLSGEPW